MKNKIEKKSWVERNLKSKRAIAFLINRILIIVFFIRLYNNYNIKTYELIVFIIPFISEILVLSLIEFEKIKIQYSKS